jgi:NAD(P)-dependent dehydrogenase (short-subunit alcohol dehydrogenase family)
MRPRFRYRIWRPRPEFRNVTPDIERQDLTHTAVEDLGDYHGRSVRTGLEGERSRRVSLLARGHCRDEGQGAGDIVFIGATASRRGGKMTAAFAPAKAAQRSLAESMARTLRPAGIHVSLIVIDGVVDLERTRAKMPDKPDDFFVDPAGVAEIAWRLTRQSPRVWSFETEARPLGEAW